MAMKHYYSSADAGPLESLITRAIQIKKAPLENERPGKNKTLVLIFLNPSLRTRLSTQKAAQNLGMQVISMNMTEGWKMEFRDGVVMDSDCAEHARDAARVISQYADIIGIRSFPALTDREEDRQDAVLNAFMNHAGVPIVNMESANFHPLQSLADFMTIREFSGKKKQKIVLTWAPHPRALPHSVVHSFLDFAQLTNHEIHICHPPGYELDLKLTQRYKTYETPEEAYDGADVVYAKNWSSTHPYGKILCQDKAWMVDEAKMKLTNRAKFMHCLPVRRNVVVSDAVIDSPQSVVYQQAANREFAAQAVLERILQNLSP